MSKKRNKELVLIFLLTGVFTFLAGINIPGIKYEPISEELITDENEGIITPEAADYWTYFPFIIDNDGGGNYTWAEAVLEDWCYGSGTWSNPYVIENMSIDGGWTSKPLTIRDSDVPFIIRNCTFSNSSSGGGNDGGLFIDNTRNGLIINNTVNSNYHGISLWFSDYNNVTENNLYNNSQNGIMINYSEFNNITNNEASDNWDGISFWDSHNCSVSENTLVNNNRAGVYINGGNENNITENHIQYNQQGGIFLVGNLTKIIENTIIDNIWNGLMLDSNSNNNTIVGNTIINHTNYGILLDATYNATISGNTIKDSQFNGLGINSSDNNFISENTINNSIWDGIFSYNSYFNDIQNNNITFNGQHGINLNLVDDNTFYRNNLQNNTQTGINLQSGSEDNLLYYNIFIGNSLHAQDDGSNNKWNNTALGNYWDNYTGLDADEDNIGDTPYNITGSANARDYLPLMSPDFYQCVNPIFIDGDATGVDAKNWTWAASQDWCNGSGTWNDPYLIQYLIIDGNQTDNGILIRDSNVYFTIQYCILYNSSSSGAGIKFLYVNNSHLVGNNCSFNNQDGIDLRWVKNITILNNIANNNTNNSIYLSNGENNTISENTMHNNGDQGIDMWYFNNNTITGNNINNNGGEGLKLSFANNNTISGNTLNLNENNGILFYASNNNSVFENTVEENNEHGICLTDNSDNNTLYRNEVYNNTQYGISVELLGGWNLIYRNNFSENNWNGIDLGSNNKWDNGTIGNYWSNYTGSDLDDNGIGDSPYSWNGVVDNYPIWDDGDNLAPRVIINTPQNNTLWITAPKINVTVYDLTLNCTWYNVTGNSTKIFLSNNTEVALDSFIWAALPQGMFQISFYANDTNGNINDTIILTLYKDTLTPQITINLPVNMTLANSAPLINVTAYDTSLDKIWYNATGVPITIFLTNNSQVLLDSNIWNALGQGFFNLTFFANDSAGNINNTIITYHYKDTLAPTITITSPISNTYWNIAPQINIDAIDETSFEFLWYEINSQQEFLAPGVPEPLNPTIWAGLPDGLFIMRIYANDSAGNLNSSLSISLYKDTSAPVITISAPSNNELVGRIGPSFDIAVSDLTLDTMWYSLDGGLTKIIFTGTTGQIDQDLWQLLWESLEDGDTITIRFYANDSFGYSNYEEVTVIKQTPLIEIIMEKLSQPGSLIIIGCVAGGLICGISINRAKYNKFAGKIKRLKKAPKGKGRSSI